MPDLKIGATVDLSAANAALQEGQQTVQQYCDRMNISFQTVTSSSQRFSAGTRNAFGSLSSEVKAAADSVSSDSLRIAEATQANASAQTQLRLAMRINRDETIDLTARTSLLASAQENARRTALELAAAEEAAGLAAQHTVTDVQATSGVIRSLEGNGGIRAVERFTADTLGLGGAMQTLFPIVGAAGLAGLVVSLGSKVIDLAHDWDQVYQAEQRALKEGADAVQAEQKAVDANEKARRDAIKRTQGKVGGLKYDLEHLKLNVESNDATVIAQAQARVDALNARIAAGTTVWRDRSGRATGSTSLNEDARIASAELPVAQTRLETAQLQRGTDQSEVAAKQSELAKAEEDAQKRKDAAARQGLAADNRAAQELLRQMETDLSEWKTQANVTISAEYDFWMARIANFERGSSEYLSVQQKISALAVEGARKAHEAIEKFKTSDQRSNIEGSSVELRTMETLSAMARTNAENVERSGKRWDEYAASVAKGSEAQATLGEQMELSRAKALEAEGGLSRLGLLQVEAGIHAEEHRRRLVALREELDRLNREATRDPFTGEVSDSQQATKIQGVQNQIAQEQGGAAIQSFQDNNAIQQQVSQPWIKAFDSIESGWMSTQRSILTGQRSVAAGFRQMGDSLALSAIEGFERMIFASAAYELKTLAAHAAGNAAKTGSDVSAAATSTAVKAQSGLREVFIDAKTAAASTWKALAGIPVVGPVLAPIAAGAAFAGVMALAAFEQGGIVAGGPGMAVPIVAHAGERVLTYNQTQRFEQMVNSSDGGRGDTHYNFNGDNHFGSNGGDFRSQWDQHEDHIVNSLKNMHRNGKLGFAKG